LNTSQLGIDFEHNGFLLKITVRYCMVDYSHEVVSSLFCGAIEHPSLPHLVPTQQILLQLQSILSLS
jgi:hypothetical protein